MTNTFAGNFCSICGFDLNSGLAHSCGGSPSYCPRCGKGAHSGECDLAPSGRAGISPSNSVTVHPGVPLVSPEIEKWNPAFVAEQKAICDANGPWSEMEHQEQAREHYRPLLEAWEERNRPVVVVPDGPSGAAKCECGSFVLLIDSDKFCRNCGRRLEWK